MRDKYYFWHYFKAPGKDRWYPVKKGVTLTLEEWDNFNESYIDIDAAVRRLRCKNEQIEHLPPKGIKRYLQSVFGREDEWVCGVFVLWIHAKDSKVMRNKIWWLCLVPTSTTRFASEVGYRIAKI